MRILHTADLHLCNDKPATMYALEQILKAAKQHSAELLTIGGDMFDSDEDAEILRPHLRKIFNSTRIQTLVIPGNHDKNAFTGGLDYGSSLRVVTGNPETIKKHDITITAVPFTERPTDELISELRAKAGGKESILLVHCTLDIGFSSQDFGEEEGPSYFPISVATLSNLGYDYILSGHFHKSTNVIRLEKGGFFVYPGSPTSHTTKECGRRQAVLVETENREPPVPVPLDTFYHDQKEVAFVPGKEKETLDELRQWVTERKGHNCHMKITTNGFIKTNEQRFGEELRKLGDQIEVENNCRDVSNVLEHPLFRRFSQKLKECKDIDCKEAVERHVIEAMALLMAGRELED